MIKKAAITLITTLSLLVVSMSPLMAVTASAASKNNTNNSGSSSAAKDAACQGVELTGGSCNDPNTGSTVNSVLATIINLFSLIVGFTAVIMVIVGGFKYVISAGDSANVNSAKNTILYALVGLVIVALSQVIVRFVLNKV